MLGRGHTRHLIPSARYLFVVHVLKDLKKKKICHEVRLSHYLRRLDVNPSIYRSLTLPDPSDHFAPERSRGRYKG